MKSLSLDSFVAMLTAAQLGMSKAEERGVRHGAEIIKKDAQDRIGHEQEEWAPLSSATLQGFHHPLAGYLPGKEELGYTGRLSSTDPLYRTGELRASIEVSAAGRKAVIGTHDKIAVYQEMGTPDAMYPIPPRPFLSAAAFAKGKDAAKAIGEEVAHALTGRILTKD